MTSRTIENNDVFSPLLKAYGWLIPDHLKESPSDLVRVGVLVAGGSMVAIIGLILTLVTDSFTGPDGIFNLGRLFMTLLILSSIFALKIYPDMKVIGGSIIVWLVTYFFLTSLVRTYEHSYFTSVFFGLPIFAAYTLGSRSGLLTLSGTAASLIGLAIIQPSEIPPINFFGASISQYLFPAITVLVLIVVNLLAITILRAYREKQRNRDDIEDALTESEERFEQSFHSAVIGMTICEVDGRFRDVNPAFCEMLGYNREELLNMSIADITHPEDRQKTADQLNSLKVDDRFGESVRKRYVRKDGDTVWSLLSRAKVNDRQGNVIYWVAQAMDITDHVRTQDELHLLQTDLENKIEKRTADLSSEIAERKRIEKELRRINKIAEEANRIKSEFLANMSHELRTPLNAILGYSEALKAGIFGPIANDKQDEYIGNIRDSGAYLLELIKDVLDLSAIEAGKLSLNFQTIDLKQTATEVFLLLSNDAKRAGVKLKSNINGDLPSFEADALRLKQSMVNLMSNAVKFSPEGSVVTLGAEHGDSDMIEITVSDEGIGMSTADIASSMVFFGQIPSAHTRQREGTGLGLPLTRGLVEAHGGQLNIESSVGAGTKVTISLPRVPDPNFRSRLSSDYVI